MSLLFNLTSSDGNSQRRIPVYIYEHGVVGLMANYWVRKKWEMIATKL